MKLNIKSQTVLDRIIAENKSPVFIKKVSRRGKSKTTKEYTKYPFVQLNIRVKYDVKFDFYDYCEEYGISPGEALSILLEIASEKTESNMKSLLKALNEKQRQINMLNEQLLDCRNKHSRFCEKVRNTIVPWYINKEKRVSSFSRHFCKLFLLENDTGVKRQSNDTMVREEMYHNYKYPDDGDGYAMVFKFESIAYGKVNKKILFIFGQDINGNDVKFIYIPDASSRYIGIPIEKYDNSHLQNLWYVLFSRNDEGVCFMIGSYPIPLLDDVIAAIPHFCPEDMVSTIRIRSYVKAQQKAVEKESKYPCEEGTWAASKNSEKDISPETDSSGNEDATRKVEAKSGTLSLNTVIENAEKQKRI